MALVRPRSPLVYPGGTPGFNKNHLAARLFLTIAASKQTGLSVAATRNYMRLLTPSGGITSASVSDPIYAIDGRIGPSAAYNTSPPNWAGYYSASNYSAMTIAAIGVGVGSSSGVPYPIIATNFNSVSGASTPLLGITPGSGLFMMINGSVNSYAYAGFPYTAGRPYFWACSYTGGAATVNFVQCALDTGQVWASSTVPNGGPLALNSTTGTIYLLSNGNSGWGTGIAKLATGMLASGELTLPELVAWANAPWDFWYPQSVLQMLLSSAGRASGANDFSFSLSDATDTAAFTLQKTNSFSFSLSDATDTASFTLQKSNQFHFGLSDAIDVAAFNLTPKNDFSFSINDATDAAAFALQKTNNFHFSLSDAVDAAAFSLSDLGNAVRFTLSDATDSASFLLAQPVDFSFAVTDAIDLAAFSLSQIAPPPIIPTGEIADYVFRYENFAKAYADPVVRPYFRKGVMIALNALVFQLGREVPISALPLPGYWFVLSLGGPINASLYLDPNLAFIINRTGQSWNNATPVYRAPQFSQVNRLEILVSSSMIYVQ